MLKKLRARLRSFLKKILPGQLMIIIYVLLSLTASAVLFIPALHKQEGISYIDCLFTTTSAICVTGLTTLDIGKSFNTFGQLFIMLLFQMGGLGIMTISTFLFHTLGLEISSRERMYLYKSYTHDTGIDLKLLIAAIVKYTLIIEIIGALVLAARWSGDFGFGRALYLGVFHSISAFMNAGFSLFTTSLTGYRGDIVTNLTFYLLIISGGIGFLVLFGLTHLKGKDIRLRRLGLHSKMVLYVSAILIISGACIFLLLESGHSLSGCSWIDKLLISFFQSITARTAGFNTIDMSGLTNATLLIIIFLMFVGASPGSCGGGIKTTSLGVIAALIYNRLRGGDRVNIMARTIPQKIVSRSIALFMVGVIIIFIFTSILLITEPETYGPNREIFIDYLFETVSAFGTVGLSMGITPELNMSGKILITILMIIGRLGPLTVAYSMARRQGKSNLEYAEENVMIG